MLSAKLPQNIQHLTLQTIRARSLNASSIDHKLGSKVFGTDLNFLIDDSLTKDSFMDTIVAEKKFSSLKVKNLQFADGNEWKGIIGNFENIIKGFNIHSDVSLDQEMEIRNLIVKGKINGVSHYDMVNKWLQLEGDQIFTAPQRFNKVTVKNLNVAVINEINVNNLTENSIYIDEPLNFENLLVKGLLAVAGRVIAPLINGEPFNQKLILNQTQDYQTLGTLTVHGHAFVQHLNFTTLNGINCNDFLNVFHGSNEMPVNLRVVGKATFTHPVNVTFLNYENVPALFSTVWLANQDVNINCENIKFLGDVRIDGALYADVSLTCC